MTRVCKQYPERTADELRQMSDAYTANVLTVKAICRQYGVSKGEFDRLRVLHKWKGRSQGGKPASYKPPKRKGIYRGAAERAADQRAIVEHREGAIYGAFVDDANFLRQRGFYVGREGVKFDADGKPIIPRGDASYRVGNTLCTGDQMRAKAERERRLMGAEPTLRQREKLGTDCERRPRPWKPDFRDGEGLDRMLIAVCIASPLLAIAILLWGGS